MSADERELTELTVNPNGQSLTGGVTRRQFLQTMAATTAGAAAFTGCRPPQERLMIESRVSLAEDITTGYENWFATTCLQCGAGCGTIVRAVEGRAKKVEGNPDHPLNQGKLCARGQATVQAQYHPDRIQGPLRRSGDRGSGKFDPITWDEALNQLVDQLRSIRQRGRASDVAFVTGPLRAHRAMLVDQFTKSYGAQWLTWNTFGDAPLREATRRVFGQATLPFLDIRNAHYLLSFGSDFLGPWISQVRHNLDYGVFRQGDYRPGTNFHPRQKSTPRGYLVQVDSRFSATAANADEWLWVPPGTEGLVALGVANALAGQNAGAAPAGAFDAYTPDRVARDIATAAGSTPTAVTADKIRQLAGYFGSKRPGLAIGGGSVGAHTNGTDALTAILGLNVLAGNVGQTGGVILNPPPAIDGLAASSTPTSLTDWQGFANRLRSGGTQLVLLKDADIVHGAPAALGLTDALQKAPFIISFSSFMDDTTAMADLILPSHLPLEDWGDDIPEPAPGMQIVTMQQPVVRPENDTRGFGDLLLLAASELGGPVQDALNWPSFKDVLRDGARTLQGLNRGSVNDSDFERFWLRLLQQGGWWDESSTGRPTFAAAAAGPALQQAASSFRPADFGGALNKDEKYLVVFPHNTLGSGENAHLPWMQATPDPVTTAVWRTWAELNPKVAADLDVQEGDIISVESAQGKIEVPVYVNPGTAPDVVAIPLGQGHRQYGQWAQDRGKNPLDLLAARADVSSGALAYASTRVRISKTGNPRIQLAKYEGTADRLATQIEGEEVAKVTRQA